MIKTNIKTGKKNVFRTSTPAAIAISLRGVGMDLNLASSPVPSRLFKSIQDPTLFFGASPYLYQSIDLQSH